MVGVKGVVGVGSLGVVRSSSRDGGGLEVVGQGVSGGLGGWGNG